ncbi:MAG: glycine cleavage system aminomethyltransferase GcvT [Alphaproteobacteria bacterium]|nr:glycine cleavage system aminomethyltransferase GcvT [Alphaproteobacteria bacterium]|tara:strand:+ start:121 stop:1203 length:1083 start_codon:yes stop_codon:yes gene_type:complete
MNIKSLQNEKYHVENNAKMVPFAGYNMPMWYSSIADEHNCVREKVGIFDVSHMGEFFVSGEMAKDFLQMVTTNDINKLTKGKVQYSSILNRSGGIIDDLLVYDMGENKYMLVVNASNMEKDFNWLNDNNNLDVEIKNNSDDYSLFAVQGPEADKVCSKVFNEELTNIKYYTFIEKQTNDFGNVIISATGYTGAGGFELYVKNEFAESLWNNIILNGNEFKIQPIGLGARDTLRLEMGFCLHGNDIDDSINPIEAELDWICKKEINFIGKEIVDRDRSNKPSKTLIGFELIEKGIPRKGYKILNKEKELVGEVTSGSISPYTKKAIGMGYISYNENTISEKIYIEIRSKKVEAQIVKRPFI